MKLIIAGASGSLGRMLVPILKEKGIDLLLVGRDQSKLERLFPGVQAADYSNYSAMMEGFDTLLNLVVVNTTATAAQDVFRSVNIDFAVELAQVALDSGISHVINISSLHALDSDNSSDYAVTKREATLALQAVCADKLTTLFLPYMYGTTWPGKLASLNKLPRPLANGLFRVFAALKPTLECQTLAQTLLDLHGPSGQIIVTDGQVDNFFFRSFKRLMDLTFVALVCGLLWWLLILVWIAIRLDSPGPGIFAQDRVGQYGKVFRCYKFRTMRRDTLQAGTHEVSVGFVTRIGSLLRSTKIDELPQVWNLIVNDMSLIGPRPGLPQQTELFAARNVKGIYRVKPGISGLAQVAGIDMSNPIKLAEKDAEYLARQSVALEISIALATIKGGGQGDNTADGAI